MPDALSIQCLALVERGRNRRRALLRAQSRLADRVRLHRLPAIWRNHVDLMNAHAKERR